MNKSGCNTHCVNNMVDTDIEYKVLCNCLSPDSEPENVDNLKRLSASGWNNILSQSLRYNIAPLIYWRLKSRHLCSILPSNIEKELREAYLSNASRNILLYNELTQVLKALRQKGISVLLLKGTHLAKFIYRNIAVRPMCDIDLLVKKSDLLQTQETLLEMGYGPQDRPSIEEQCATHHHLLIFFKTNFRAIEIHWTLSHLNNLSFAKVDEDELWLRAKPVEVNGVEVFVLSTEDLILHLCFHTSFHHIFHQCLIPLCDIAETIRLYQEQISWKRIQQLSNSWAADKCIFIVLHLAKELMGAAVPEDVLRSLKPASINPKEIAYASKQIFTPSTIPPIQSRNLAHLLGAEQSRFKATVHMLKIIFPSKLYLMKRYNISRNSLLIYLYYIIRPFDLIFRYAGSLWHFVSLKEEMSIWSSMRVEKKP